MSYLLHRNAAIVSGEDHAECSHSLLELQSPFTVRRTNELDISTVFCIAIRQEAFLRGFTTLADVVGCIVGDNLSQALADVVVQMLYRQTRGARGVHVRRRGSPEG